MFKVNGGKLDPRNSLQEALFKCFTWELENLGLLNLDGKALKIPFLTVFVF